MPALAPADLIESTTGALRVTVTVSDGGSGLVGMVPQIDYYVTGGAYDGYESMTNLSGDTWYFDIPDQTWAPLVQPSRGG